MDAQQFLAEFGHIANAPGGIGKLRELILSLAVTGKLVPQVESELPATDWLSGVDNLKTKLAKEGKIPKHAKTDGINSDDVPFQPPSGWTFARLGLCSNSPLMQISSLWAGGIGRHVTQ
jgi:type I restriction enzyme S subunit